MEMHIALLLITTFQSASHFCTNSGANFHHIKLNLRPIFTLLDFH